MPPQITGRIPFLGRNDEAFIGSFLKGLCDDLNCISTPVVLNLVTQLAKKDIAKLHY